MCNALCIIWHELCCCCDLCVYHIYVVVQYSISGHLVQSLTIQPKSNLHNSAHFQKSFVRWTCLLSGLLNASRHCLWNDFVTFPNIRAFTYTFPCNFAKRGDKLEIYGTGGTMLQSTRNLLRVSISNLKNSPTCNSDVYISHTSVATWSSLSGADWSPTRSFWW